jgi:hypothetical protein
MGLLAILLASCEDDTPVGMTLLFQSSGRPVVVRRFDPDGMRGPVPGSVGSMSPLGGKEMAFMPHDSKRGIPKFVDVAWAVPTKEYENWSDNFHKKSGAERYSPEGDAEYKQAWAKVPGYTKRVDLATIITPELIDQVRSDNQNTQLKLTITFNNDDVDIKALAYKWR